MENSKTKILALKYRPKIFQDLLGQEVISETIFNSIKIGKTPNSYLLTGIRGVGKTTTARLIAKALNCIQEKDQTSDYDVKDLCIHCKQITDSNHIDVLEMDAASKTGIDDIRELIESAKYNPTSAKYKIFIIDEVHMLSKQAFNGLLKTLEEPPEKLKFILATTEARKIPVTILSRCQRFDLKRVSLTKIFDHLKKILKAEGGKISDNAIKLLARASEGSVRDSISLLDRAIAYQNLNKDKILEENDIRKMLGLADKSSLIELLRSIFDGNENEAFKKLNELLDEGLDARNFLNDVLELIYLFTRRINLGPIDHDLLISENELQLIEKNSKNLNISDLSIFWQLTLKTLEDLKTVSNENLIIEMYVHQLMHIKDIDENAQYNETENTKVVSALSPETKKTENINEENLSSNRVKNQLKNTDQLKTFKEEKKIDNKSNINSFLDLISLAEKEKEIELKYDLERNVRLINFENGKIDINFNENLNKNFIKKLSQNLEKWTGKRWIITLSKNNENSKTFHENKKEEKTKELSEGKKSEVYNEITKAFSDAELLSVEEIDE
tara:strand:+ start:2982 stop:4655 length:1674 start_codon:yes stop_codon:yes gene_type:complete